MRSFLMILVLYVAPALAQTQSDDGFLKGEALQAEVDKSCGDGCITFNRDEAAKFKEAMKELVDEAFQAGQRQQKAACRSLI
jgi:hypothetical protein